MKYAGIVTKEGLKDEGFLNFALNLQELDGLLKFELDDEFAPAVISEMKEALRSGPYYGVVSSEFEVNFIFAEKVATCKPDDQEAFEKAVKYATSLGIGEAALAQYYQKK